MVLGVISLVLLESRLRVTYRTPLSGCAHENGTGGASGVYRWAERIGVPVQILGDPMWEASRSLRSVEGNCIVTMGNGPWLPTGETLDPASWVTTREWVARGNTLIVVTGEPGTLPSEMRKELIPPAIQESGSDFKVFEKVFVNREVQTSRAPFIFGGALEIDPKGPRWTVPSPPAAGAGTGGCRKGLVERGERAERGKVADCRG